MAINELRSVTTFVRAAELGSLSQAARAQQITPQAASKALVQLEQHLGVRLFHRTTRSLSLTEEGQRLFDTVQGSLAGLHAALEDVRHARSSIAGPLRIVGPRSALTPVLGPLLAEYGRLYPEVQPDVQLDDRIGNWVEERTDVGFRLGNAPQPGLIARRLFPLQLIVCAAPDYLRRHGAPTTLADLATHRCSAYRRPGDERPMPWHVRVDGALQMHAVQPALVTNDEAYELRALLAGEVIAQATGPTVVAHIRAGRLVPLLLEHVSDDYHLYVYYGSRSAQPARVRLFIDLAVDRLADGGGFVLSEEELRVAAAAQAR